MLKRDDVEAEEERLRERANALTQAERKAFYQRVTRELKDPDTYAALNWFVVTGLHHFYLGRWRRGVLTLGLTLLGVGLLFTPQRWLGVACLLTVAVLETVALFRSQIIVQNWNNRIYRRILQP